MKINQLFKLALTITVATLAAIAPTIKTFAVEGGTTGFLVSPMNQSIILSPGDVYHGSFVIANPNDGTEDFSYEIERRSFYVDDEYSTVYDEVDSPIVEWTTIDAGATGTLSPNESATVMFTIDVPRNAAAGGQYEAFRVLTQPESVNDDSSESGLAIQEQLVITHLLFAEVAGSTIRQGEILDASVPSFLFGGKISGSSSIRNTGNMYGTATYTLQVFPLFSDEEIYTNVESKDNDKTRLILPDRTFYNETIWNDTPAVGIFNVIYTVEFEGVTTEVSKMVIVCPLWLLFIIIFAIVAIIIYFVMRSKSRKK